nr:DNA-directed RNA polymerase subunit H [Kaumoebavirus]
MLRVYEPFVVYQNVIKFAEKRGLKVINKTNFNEMDFAKHMRNNSYCLMEYVDGEKSDKKISLLILEPGSIYVKKSADFNKLLEKYGADSAELVAITKEPLNTHINNKIKKFTDDNATRVNNYLYRVFLYDFSNSKHCTYVKLTDEEQKAVRDEFLVSNQNFPKARSYDPDVIWLGAAKGTIVKIIRDSEVTGQAIAYREIV